MAKAIRKARETDFPEVVAFVEARDDLAEYRAEHADVFATYDALAERYNTALEAAEKIIRTAEVSCGPFELKHFATKYNGEKLFVSVGRDKFLELGGVIGSKPTYEIDKARFEAAVATKKVSKDIVEQVRVETPNFHTPKKAVNP